jgi:hypothetical protein
VKAGQTDALPERCAVLLCSAEHQRRGQRQHKEPTLHVRGPLPLQNRRHNADKKQNQQPSLTLFHVLIPTTKSTVFVGQALKQPHARRRSKVCAAASRPLATRTAAVEFHHRTDGTNFCNEGRILVSKLQLQVVGFTGVHGLLNESAEMPFIENGRVVERRSIMRAGTIADVFWGLLNTIYAFFHCMFSVLPPLPDWGSVKRERFKAGRMSPAQSRHSVLLLFPPPAPLRMAPWAQTSARLCRSAALLRGLQSRALACAHGAMRRGAGCRTFCTRLFYACCAPRSGVPAELTACAWCARCSRQRLKTSRQADTPGPLATGAQAAADRGVEGEGEGAGAVGPTLQACVATIRWMLRRWEAAAEVNAVLCYCVHVCRVGDADVIASSLGRVSG